MPLAARIRKRPRRKPRLPRGPARRVRSPQPPRAVEHYLVAALVRTMRHVTKAMARALDGKLEAIAKPDADEEREDAARLDAPPPPPADGDVDAAIREVTRAAYEAIEESDPQVKGAARTAAKRTAKHSEHEFWRLKITLKREPEIDKLITASTKERRRPLQGHGREPALEKLEALLDEGYGMRRSALASRRAPALPLHAVPRVARARRRRRGGVTQHILIIGPPRVGKTHLARELSAERGLLVRHSDDLIASHAWSDASAAIAEWLDEETPAIIEENRRRARHPEVARGASRGQARGRDPPEQTPREQQTPKQVAMGKGVMTVWNQIAGDLAARGVKVTTF